MIANNSLIIIAGPTAIGKTALGIKLAKELNCPIISADSRQFYQEMNIGTAKPSRDEMDGVPHYLIDSHSIFENYNVGMFEKEVIDLLDNIFLTNKQVIMVGGSGLYVDAIVNGIDNLPEANPEARNKVKELLSKEGIEGLQKLLKALDPEYFLKVDQQNPQRMSRALEVCITTGKTYTALRTGTKTKRNFKIHKIGLNTSREILYQRINERVDAMMTAGLLEEVKRLFPHKDLNALQTVGYKELFSFLEEEIDLKTAIDLIKQNTRRFAKRQLTWFRRDEEMPWFQPEDYETISSHLKNKISF